VTILRNWSTVNNFLIFLSTPNLELHFCNVLLMCCSHDKLQSNVTPKTFISLFVSTRVPAISNCFLMYPVFVKMTDSVLLSLTTSPRFLRKSTCFLLTSLTFAIAPLQTFYHWISGRPSYNLPFEKFQSAEIPKQV